MQCSMNQSQASACWAPSPAFAPRLEHSSSTSPSSSYQPQDHLTLPPLSWTRHATLETRLPSIPEILNQPHSYLRTSFQGCSTSVHPVAFPKPAFSGPISEWKPSTMPKRPRRRFHEVERKYSCTFPGCGKAYGALNHLNAHIVSRSHGRRRKAREFVPSPPSTPSSSQ